MMHVEWWESAIRGFNFVVLGLTTGLCLGQSLWRRRLRRVALFAYASLAAAVAYAQLDLIDTPITNRTWPIVYASLVQVAYWIYLFFADGDDEAEARQWAELPLATRDLIRRHPELLPAFARWHRHHTTGTGFEDLT